MKSRTLNSTQVPEAEMTARKCTESRVLGWIEENAGSLLANLRELISIPSVTGSEARCQRVVEKAFCDFCDRVDVWEPEADLLEQHPAYFAKGSTFDGRPNVVGIIRGKTGGRSMILNAHVDVVDPGPATRWRQGAWSATFEDGRVYGRGAVDDKAGLAIMLFLARCLRDMDISLAGDLILQSVVDEEWGGAGTLSAVQRGYRADAAILFEPSGLEICPAARGGQAFRVSINGRGRHPIRAYEGVSALEKALPILSGLKSLECDRQERLRTDLFRKYPIFVPIVIGKISADEFPSKVPEKCTLEGLMGYAAHETFQEARDELESCVAGIASADPWLRENPPVIEWLGLNKEGAQIASDHPIVQLMGECFRDVLGREAEVSGWLAGCDFPYLVRHGQIPSVIFGPGDAGLAHTSDENVVFGEVLDAVKVVATAVLRWCEVQGE